MKRHTETDRYSRKMSHKRNHIAKDLHETKYRQRVRNREHRYIPKPEEYDES